MNRLLAAVFSVPAIGATCAGWSTVHS
jgi:hypothetical protein